MFKFALFFKFPSIKVVELPLTRISPLFVSVPDFGVKIHVQTWFNDRTHETFPWEIKHRRSLSAELAIGNKIYLADYWQRNGSIRNRSGRETSVWERGRRSLRSDGGEELSWKEVSAG